MSLWKKLSSKIVYENPWIRVYEDEVINPIGEKTVYGYVQSTANSSVGIIPIDDEGYIYLVRQFRYALQEETWEIVAGRTDKDENTKLSAIRELKEETGLEASEIIYLGNLSMAPGATSFNISIYLAKGIRKVSDTLDPLDGILEVKRVSVDQVHDMITDGTLRCSASIAAFFMAMSHIKKELHD